MKRIAAYLLTAALGLVLAGCAEQQPPAGPAAPAEPAGEQGMNMHSPASSASPDTRESEQGIAAAEPVAQFPAYTQMRELVEVDGTVEILRGDLTTQFGQTLKMRTDNREYELEYTDTFNAWWGPTGTEFAKITSVLPQPKYFYQNERFLFLFFEAYGGMDYDAAYIMCLHYGTRHFTSFSQELAWEGLRMCESLDGLLYVYTASTSLSGKDSSFRVMVFDPLDEDSIYDAQMLHNEVYDFGLVCESFAAGEDGVTVRFRESDRMEIIPIF